MTTVGYVLLGLTVLLTVLLNALLNWVVPRMETGAAASGMVTEWLSTLVLVFLTWVSLSGLLFWASRQNLLPPWVSIASVLLCPASGAALLATLYVLYETRDRSALLIPMVIPGLLAAYVFALSRPAWHTSVARLGVSLAVVGLVAVLCAMVFNLVYRELEDKQRRRVQQERNIARATALIKLSAMNPEMALTEWHDLIAPESLARNEALQALRKLDRRQADMEQLVGSNAFYMALVPELDLKPTPALCQAAQDYLLYVAKSKDAWSEPGLDGSLEAVSWFTAHGCDCRAGLAAIESSIRNGSPDNAARRQMLAAIKRLQQ